MSHSAGLADYRAALTTPGVGIPVLTGLLARLPIAMIGFSLLLYVQRETGSFAIAGMVSAGVLIGVAIGAVVQGRVMDRLGPARPLLLITGLFAVAITAETVAVETGQPTALLVSLAWLVGFTEPQVASVSRAMWTRLLPPGPTRHAGYAYEAISMEVFFILGPAVSGLLVAAPWAGTGVALGSLCMVAGAVGFALTPVIKAIRPETSSGGRLLGALASPGMRTVALAALGFGVTVGFVEVAVPAAATNAGHPTAGGLMLALWSTSSVLFGLWYTSRPWPRAMHHRLPALLAVFAVLVAPMAIPDDLLWLTVLMLVAGMWITPQSTTHSTSIELVVPRGTETEAFGWVITAVTLGLAIGHSSSGHLVEHVGVWSAFLASAAAGTLIAALVWLRRRTVTATPSHRAQATLAAG